MAILTGYIGRYLTRHVTITDQNSTTFVFESGDVMRIKFGRTGKTPILDLDSVAASPNGSTLTAANPTTMKIKPADMSLFDPGAYDMEVSIYDATGGHIKHACMNVFHAVSVPLGDVGAS